MHCTCWDPDALRSYTHTWLRLRQTTLIKASIPIDYTACATSSYHSQILEVRIRKLEARLSPPPGSTTISSKSYASAIGTSAIVSPPNDHNCTIQSKNVEVLEQEKRKKNAISYNMTSSRTFDVSHIEILLEDIAGNFPSAFCCRRIDKTLAGNTRPILAEFLSKSDS